MDAVTFLEEWKRMHKNGRSVPALDANIDFNSEKVVKIVEEWSAEHPRKTRQSEFLKHYPKADILNNGVVSVCPKLIEGYNPSAGCCVIDCYDCKTEYWTQEVE